MSTQVNVPKSGRAVLMRNAKTGAPWRVSFDYMAGQYHHEPLGNLRHIRQPFVSSHIGPNLIPAGTH